MVYMPKVPINYSNTVFYRIYCNDAGRPDTYIGHTTNFVQRKYLHKQGCKNETYPQSERALYTAAGQQDHREPGEGSRRGPVRSARCFGSASIHTNRYMIVMCISGNLFTG